LGGEAHSVAAWSKTMKKQPIDQAITLGEFGHQTIRRNFDQFVKQEKWVLSDQDPEPLHQMRVNMRRLRTAVYVFNAAVVLPKPVSSAAIGKIAKSLGETRDLDVLRQELTTSYQPLLHQREQSNFEAVLKHLHQRRKQSFLHLKKTLHSDRYHTLKGAIEDWLAKPVYTRSGQVAVQPVLPDLLLPLVSRLFLHPGWLVGTTIQAGEITLIPLQNTQALSQQLEEFSEVLHDLRKRIKGVRYQAEFFSSFYGQDYKERLEEFKRIQDILGQLQDQAVLRQFLEATLSHDVAEALPSVDQKIRQQQATFWQTWQPLQQNYLSAEFRQSLRSLLTQPHSPPPAGHLGCGYR
jgi:CHAD domain-containing protein